MIQRFPSLGLTLDEDHADRSDGLLLAALEGDLAARRAATGRRIIDGLETLMQSVTGLAAVAVDAVKGAPLPRLAEGRGDVDALAAVLDDLACAVRALPDNRPSRGLVELLATRPGVERIEP